MLKLILLVNLVLAVAFAQNNRSARIVGGRDAHASEAPYHVSLRSFGSTFHFCGGALVSNRWAITTATCIFGRARNSLNLVAGSNLLSSGGVARRSSNIVIHPFFVASGIDNNLGLIQVNLAFPFNRNIMPINVSSRVIRGSVQSSLVGFGAVGINGGPNSERLQIIHIDTLPDPECSDAYPGLDITLHLCTANSIGEGFCTSDLGGPLVANNELIGVASSNIPCAIELYDIFVRISPYRLWIGSIIGV